MFDDVSAILARALSSNRVPSVLFPLLSSATEAHDAHARQKMMRFYSNLIKKGDVCFDIGANIGKFTQTFLELGAKVICVEPQEACLRSLNQSFRKNLNVVIVGKALGSSEGTGKLMICEQTNTISTMSNTWVDEGPFSKEAKWTKTEAVPLTTLDNLILIYGTPQYCKIDVEDYELQVLKGLSQPIEFISFEFHKLFFKKARECMNQLLTIGDATFNFMLWESMQFLFQKWMTSEELCRKLIEKSHSIDDFWGDIYAKFPQRDGLK